MKRVALVLVVLLAGVAVGLYLADRQVASALDDEIVKAEQEAKRLEYVTKRYGQLARRRQELQIALGLDATVPPPPPLHVPHVRTAEPVLPAIIRPGLSGIRRKQEHLRSLSATIDRGLDLEKQLPEIQRELVSLERQLAEGESG